MVPPGSGRNPYKFPIGDDRAQIQSTLHTNLKQVPGVQDVRLERSNTGVGHQLVGDIDTDVYADGIITCDEAHVQINWWPLHDEEDRHWYQFHYYEESGFDCGWHRQENDHVDGLDHYQERESNNQEDYEYYGTELTHSHPVGILWEILQGRLVTRLEARHLE